ncbi:hypothetical protein HPP92_004943 [Vanilla planifolia]|uniref:BHLH domain-containing protein n=1 Tax=Vanilla planifolia TaxID=51239 RepID=A0A835RRA1_VANPL|nr:hypothetical protein HPP92_004943 [Vanilla planifolia]
MDRMCDPDGTSHSTAASFETAVKSSSWLSHGKHEREEYDGGQKKPRKTGDSSRKELKGKELDKQRSRPIRTNNSRQRSGRLRLSVAADGGWQPQLVDYDQFEACFRRSPSLLHPSSSPLTQYLQPSNSLSLNCSIDGHELPQSWSQLLLGGLASEEERSGVVTPFRRSVDWVEQLIPQSNGVPAADVKQEINDGTGSCYGYVLPVSSPRSSVTSRLSSNMLDFSNSTAARTSECNSMETGVALKKARVQSSPSSQSTFKVRKEKLGDRITALHQLVSPFGKTDTASVLLEAIGYIRFLQGQIEALSSPYLTTGSGNTCRPARRERSCIFPEDPGQLLNDNCTRKRGPADQGEDEDEPKKDLRSRGLCLVPVSCTLHVGSDNGADYWAPLMGGELR